MHGELSVDQRQALAPYVGGRAVCDLGAGNGDLSFILLGELRAARVVAFDKQPFTPPKGRVEVVTAYFTGVQDLAPDVAFVSWPINRAEYGLFKILRAAATVVYLGKNTDGFCCGHPDLFEDLLRRELLVYVPEPRNTLIVAGKLLKRPRKPTGEERAGISMFKGRPKTFAEAEGFSKGKP